MKIASDAPDTSVTDDADGHTGGETRKPARQAGGKLSEPVEEAVLLSRVDCGERGSRESGPRQIATSFTRNAAKIYQHLSSRRELAFSLLTNAHWLTLQSNDRASQHESRTSERLQSRPARSE